MDDTQLERKAALACNLMLARWQHILTPVEYEAARRQLEASYLRGRHGGKTCNTVLQVVFPMPAWAAEYGTGQTVSIPTVGYTWGGRVS